MAPSKQFDSSNGTSFVVDGETVEITRADQPIFRVPLSDILEFSATKPVEDAPDLECGGVNNLHQSTSLFV